MQPLTMPSMRSVDFFLLGLMLPAASVSAAALLAIPSQNGVAAVFQLAADYQPLKFLSCRRHVFHTLPKSSMLNPSFCNCVVICEAFQRSRAIAVMLNCCPRATMSAPYHVVIDYVAGGQFDKPLTRPRSGYGTSITALSLLCVHFW